MFKGEISHLQGCVRGGGLIRDRVCLGQRLSYWEGWFLHGLFA